MTRDEDGSFQFRRRYLQTKGEKCISEEEALLHFFDFLETKVMAGVILVCMDEDTVGVLVSKLKALDRKRCKKLVVGFSWWRRTLKHLSFPNYRTLDLEDCSQSSLTPFPESLKTAEVVAHMLAGALRLHDVAKVALSAELRPKQRTRQVRENEQEVLEIYSSFRPDLALHITAEKMDQVYISDSEDEYGIGKVQVKHQEDDDVLLITSDSTVELSQSNESNTTGPTIEVDIENEDSIKQVDLPRKWWKGGKSLDGQARYLSQGGTQTITQVATGATIISEGNSFAATPNPRLLDLSSRHPDMSSKHPDLSTKHPDSSKSWIITGDQVVCPLCKNKTWLRMSKSQGKLNKHIKKAHSNTTPGHVSLDCKECGEKNVKFADLVSHINEHNKKRKAGDSFQDRQECKKSKVKPSLTQTLRKRWGHSTPFHLLLENVHNLNFQ